MRKDKWLMSKYIYLTLRLCDKLERELNPGSNCDFISGPQFCCQFFFFKVCFVHLFCVCGRDGHAYAMVHMWT